VEVRPLSDLLEDVQRFDSFQDRREHAGAGEALEAEPVSAVWSATLRLAIYGVPVGYSRGVPTIYLCRYEARGSTWQCS